MERVDGQEPLDGEQEDDPWAGHPASGWGDEPEAAPRPAEGEQRATVAPEAMTGEPEAFEDESKYEATANPEWETAPEPESQSYPAGARSERGDVPDQAGDHWQPHAYDDEPYERAPIEPDRPRPVTRAGSWLSDDESPEEARHDEAPIYGRRGDGAGRGRDDRADDRYGGASEMADADYDESQPEIARTSPWQPAESFADRKPWEAGAEAEEGDDARRRRPGMRPGHMAPQRAARVAEEEPVVVLPARVETPAERHGRYRTLVREVVETGLLAILVFLSVRASFQNFKVDGASMQPTLENGQFLIVNKLIYSEIDLEKLGTFFPFIDGGDNPRRNVFHGPERGDIVVLQDPRSPDTDLIKRIIGLPGETLEISDGKVFVNDFLLEEPYITSEWNDTRPKIAIPEDYYFVMGDNRENSLDSRSQQVGLIHKDLIIGKAMFSYWPTGKFGLTPNGSGRVTDEERPVVTARRIEEFVPAD